MPLVPFRETYTLSDSVERIGGRLYSETWTGDEYMYSAPKKSPDEIAEERKPLEAELSAAEAKLRQIEAAIRKTMGDKENRRLAARRGKLETSIGQLRGTLSFHHPLNEIVIGAYNAHVRWQTATETLLDAIKGFKLKVHDGRGRELNRSVWTHSKFRYYLDLSIVVNPRSSGEARRQAARIYRHEFENWLASLRPIVEAIHERSAEERLTEFLRQEISAMKPGSRKTKLALREGALERISGVSLRMFERIWAAEAPPESRKAGAPRKPR